MAIIIGAYGASVGHLRSNWPVKLSSRVSRLPVSQLLVDEIKSSDQTEPTEPLLGDHQAGLSSRFPVAGATTPCRTRLNKNQQSNTHGPRPVDAHYHSFSRKHSHLLIHPAVINTHNLLWPSPSYSSSRNTHTHLASSHTHASSLFHSSLTHTLPHTRDYC